MDYKVRKLLERLKYSRSLGMQQAIERLVEIMVRLF